MSRRVAILLLLASTAALVLWLGLDPSGSGQDPLLGGQTVDESETAETGTSKNDSTRPGSSMPGMGARRSADGSDTDKARQDDTDEDTIACLIHVREARTLKSVANAEIFVLDDDELRAWTEAREEEDEAFMLGRESWGAHRACTSAGTRLRTEADGTAQYRLSRHAFAVYIVAKSEDGQARGYLPAVGYLEELPLRKVAAQEGARPDETSAKTLPTITVTIGASRDFRVQLVDRQHRSVPNLDCALFVLDRVQDAAYRAGPRAPEDNNYRDARPAAHFRSNDEGEIEISHVQALVDDILEDDPDELPTSLLVVPMIPMRKATCLRIPLAYTTQSTWKLALPPTARLELRFEHADGSPIVSAIHSLLARDEEEPLRHGHLALDLDLDRRVKKPFGAKDAIVFPHVGTQVKLTHGYEFEKQGFGLEETIPPLRREGRVQHATRLPKHIAALRVKVSMEGGAPLPEAIHVHCAIDGVANLSRAWPADPDACMRFVLKTRGSPVRLATSFWDPVMHTSAAALPTTRVRGGRENVLPDVVLRKFESFASGSCRDERGEAIRGATIRLYATHRYKRMISNLGTSSDARGKFRLPIPLANTSGLELRASAKTHDDRSMRLRLDSEHAFVMPRRAHVRVQIRGLPRSLRSTKITYAPIMKPRRAALHKTCLLKIGSADVLFPASPPGRVLLTCDPRGFFGSWSKEVKIEAGSTSTIELAAPPIHEYRFELEPSWKIGVKLAKNPRVAIYGARESIAFDSDSVTIQSFARQLELVFRRPGYESLYRSWAPGSHSLSFRRPPTTRIEIAGLDAKSLQELEALVFTYSPPIFARKGVVAMPDKRRYPITASGLVQCRLDDPRAPYDVHLVRKAARIHHRLAALRIPAGERLSTYRVAIGASGRDRVRAILSANGR